MSFDDDIDFDKLQADTEPLSLAKEIFAEIADASIEAGMSGLRHDFSPEFDQTEPAEWFPPEGNEFDEDELMIIIDEEDSEYISEGFAEELSKSGLQQSMSTSGVPELETV